MKPFIIGVDLGTTNCAVSYVDLRQDVASGRRIRIFDVPQLTGAGEFAPLPVLPSFLYIPGKYDISPDAMTIPWPTESDRFVGAFARDHGSKVPARLVSSAKSWLCHAGVDRNARILPWGAGKEVSKVSPVQATAAYLSHIRRAWNNARGDDEDLYMEHQVVIITVPASFDEAARELTAEAAAAAGLGVVTLLEEPLAAFYSWLIRHEKNWADLVRPGELILVCDVGGGTTDFTLITLREAEGSPRFERIAVGDHLILGGDNIDLALARRIEMQFLKKQSSLGGDRWKTLCHQCRQAKEVLLNNEAESKKITLMGEGRKLIAETLSATLRATDVEETVLEGFFPLADPAPRQAGGGRKGIAEFGLPYEQEPAITRHVGWFLEQHRDDIKKFLDRDDCAPDLILFNGGSLKSAVVQDRIQAAVRHWFGETEADRPRVLENPNPDLAVALGASYYGLVKIGEGVRVGSGAARAYYLGVATGEATEKQAICLVERGLEEGSTIALTDKEMEVLANQPVSFDIYSSSYRSGDRSGDLIQIDDTLTALPPIQTVVQYGKKGVQSRIPVQIEAEYTETGALVLWCRSTISSHRWQLRFQLRDAAAPADVSEVRVFEESVAEDARGLIRAAFADPSDTRRPASLVKDIAAAVETPREKWPLGFIRSLADALLPLSDVRRSRHELESRWLNLTGFCMRPGFGDGADEHRVNALWKLYKPGPVHAKNPQARAEWWIFWRRIAGGLTAGRQRQFVQDLSPIMLSAKAPKGKMPPQERLEVWMAAANMERMLVKDKVKWGRRLLSEIDPKKSKPQHLWSLSRIGARALLYGPADRVIPPDEAASWIDALMKTDWPDIRPAGAAVAQMARKTGDRIRDLDPAAMEKVMAWISSHKELVRHLKILEQAVPMEKQEAQAAFGESLPSGLILR